MKKIFVDDVRMKPERYDMVFLTMEEFLDYIKENPTEELFVSLDHDMGENVMNGNAMVDKLVYMDNNIKHVQIHSSNPPAALSMLAKLKSAKKVGLFSADMVIDEHTYEVVDGVETRRLYRAN